VLELPEHVRAAASRADVRDAVARVYADLQREIDARRPICVASGRCCRFEEFGHRLYVTTLELAAFVAELPVTSCQLPEEAKRSSLPLLATGNSQLVTASCPFQVAKLCSVHAIRPFGCRMFFCDATSTQWQNERYEQFHAELKRLHEELNVPYMYVEWRQALAALGLAGGQSSAGPGSSAAAEKDLSRT
jgi:Fe-S-cluster containining protein